MNFLGFKAAAAAKLRITLAMKKPVPEATTELSTPTASDKSYLQSLATISSILHLRMAQVISHIFQFERMFQTCCCGNRKFTHLIKGWILFS